MHRWTKPLLVSSALVAGVATAAGQTPPDVDHYTCHTVVDAKIPAQSKFPKDSPPASVRAIPFADGISGPLLPATPLYDVKKYKELCLPSAKSHDDHDFPILRPTVHLVELQIGVATKLATDDPISQPKFPGTTVRITDQFRDRQVELKKPISVLVRASKSDYGPAIKCKTAADCDAAGATGYLCQPEEKGKLCLPPPEGAPPTQAAPPADIGADNYVCYQVKPPKEPVDPAVSISNQFTVAIASQPPFNGSLRYDLAKLTKFCAPADKAGENPGAQNHVGYLACYQAKLSKTDPKQPKFAKREAGVQTINFGRRYFDVKKEREICVPAFKDQSGPTPTPTPAATPTPGGATPTPGGPTPTPTPPVGCTSATITISTSYTPPVEDVSGVTTNIVSPGPKLQRNGNPQNLSGVGGIFNFGDNDLAPPGDGFNDTLSVGLLAIPGDIPPGTFASAAFNCRAGAAAPVPGDFACTSDVSDENGLTVPSTCAVQLVVTP